MVDNDAPPKRHDMDNGTDDIFFFICFFVIQYYSILLGRDLLTFFVFCLFVLNTIFNFFEKIIVSNELFFFFFFF